MKLTKKEYTTTAEKRMDFFIGIGVFFGVNVLVYVLRILLAMALTYLPLSAEGKGYVIYGAACLAYPLQISANAGVIIYFALTRSWIALGMVGTFAFLMLLVVVLGIIASIVCFIALGSGQ